MSLIKRFMQEESGATAIEYALIAGIIALGIIVAARTLEDQISASFTNSATILRQESVKQ